MTELFRYGVDPRRGGIVFHHCKERSYEKKQNQIITKVSVENFALGGSINDL
jgi:hypothetical protein